MNETNSARLRARSGRRAFLQKAAVGTAAAWVTPTLVSVPARAGTCSPLCTPTTVSWLSSPFGAGTDIVADGPFVVNGTTITGTRTNTDLIANGNYTTGVISGDTMGNQTGFLPLCRISNRTPQAITVTLDFSPAITALSFILLDIDSYAAADTNYREEAVVSWTDATGSSTPSYTPGVDLAATGANSYAMIYDNVNCGATGTDCTLGVDFDACGTISQLSITSNNLKANSGTSNIYGRMIGIASLTFCV